MTMSRFDEMDVALRGAVTAGAAGDEAIAQAEQTLGVRLPPSYRFFLRTYGAALCEGFELAGLFDDMPGTGPPTWSNVVSSTLRLRRTSKGAIPHAYVAVSGDGGDYIYYIDTARTRHDGESPIVALGPGIDGAAIAESFLEYVIGASQRT